MTPSLTLQIPLSKHPLTHHFSKSKTTLNLLHSMPTYIPTSQVSVPLKPTVLSQYLVDGNNKNIVRALIPLKQGQLPNFQCYQITPTPYYEPKKPISVNKSL